MTRDGAVYQDVLELPVGLELPGFWKMKLPDGSETDMNRHFTTGPVAAFLVDDVFGTAKDLREAGGDLAGAFARELETLGVSPRPRTGTSTSSPRIPESAGRHEDGAPLQPTEPAATASRSRRS